MTSEYEPYTECVDCGATYDLDEETGYCCNEYECSLRQTKERSFRNGCVVGAAIVAWGSAIRRTYLDYHEVKFTYSKARPITFDDSEECSACGAPPFAPCEEDCSANADPWLGAPWSRRTPVRLGSNGRQ